MSSLLEVIFGLIFCIGAFLWWWQRSARLYWEKNGVSYIPGPPFIGVLKDVAQFKKSFGELFLDLYNHEKFKDEPITGVYFFHKPGLVVRHPELIKKILIKDFPNFTDRGVSSGAHDVIGSENLFAAKGDRWRNIRHKLSPFLTTTKLKNFFLLLLNVNKFLDQKLAMETDDKPREFEMKDLAAKYTMDSIAICAYGVQANSLLDANAEFNKYASAAFDFKWRRAMEFSTCFFLPKLAALLRFTFFAKETNDFLISSINYVMEERARSGKKCNDLIDILIALKAESPEIFYGDTAAAQAAIFLLAGYETSSSAISFALYELARHPEIQEKLRKEIKDYAEKYGSLQYETINEMQYLHNVVKETVRLYPAAPFLDRIYLPVNTEESYSLEPYHKFSIPSGMRIYVPSVAINRDPQYFENPLEFIPERFNSENRDKNNPSNYLSFGIGPRNCVGARFGNLQVKMFLYTILKTYKVEATERTPKVMEFHKKSLIINSEHPLYMNLMKI